MPLNYYYYYYYYYYIKIKSIKQYTRIHAIQMFVMGLDTMTSCFAERYYACGNVNHTLASTFCEYEIYAT